MAHALHPRRTIARLCWKTAVGKLDTPSLSAAPRGLLCGGCGRQIVNRLSSTNSQQKFSSTKEKGAQAKPSYLNVFDRDAKGLQRRRAAAMEDSNLYDYLKDEV
jgi:hypothetical protein